MKRIGYEELKGLAHQRLVEAKILLQNEQFEGAIYLAGYSIELALKARICKVLDTDFYPENLQGYKTHRFETLVILVGLERKLNLETAANDLFNSNWMKVSLWEETLRYSPVNSGSQSKANELVKAIEDEEHGILTWIKGLW